MPKKMKEVQKERTGLSMCFGWRGLQGGKRKKKECGVKGRRRGADTFEQSRKLIQRRTQEMREKRSKERERRGTERVEARVGRKS